MRFVATCNHVLNALRTAVLLAAAAALIAIVAAVPFQRGDWLATVEAASGQAATTEFEEASIRECAPEKLPPGSRGGGTANSFRMTPGRTSGLCLTLATLIRTAYGAGLLDGPTVPGEGVQPQGVFRFNLGMTFNRPSDLGVENGQRVRGGPHWVRSALYTIEAVAAGTADAQTMRGPMLRALLERRFGLKVHVESEQIPALKLTVAPGGLKMKEGTCTRSDSPVGRVGSAAAMTEGVRRNLDAARRGAPTTEPCGDLGAVNGPNLLAVGAGVGVPHPQLRKLFDLPIVDETGIPNTVSFNYLLEFALDDSLPRHVLDRIPPGGGDMQIASDPSAVPRAPGIFTALEEQLGLRLERIRAPRDFIVIDQVERPAPN